MIERTPARDLDVAPGVEIPASVEILGRWRLALPAGYAGLPRPAQATALRVDGVRVYVRENLRASSLDHFLTSSGERIRRKGVDGPRNGIDVLELAAPAALWDRLAARVAALDTLGRPVVRHPRWTLRTAPEWIAKGRPVEPIEPRAPTPGTTALASPPMGKPRSTERYTTIAGGVLEYPTPALEVAQFLARVHDAAQDPRLTEPELTELIYSLENPLLDRTIFPGRGAVTADVYKDPVYHVMLDLLQAKRVQMGTLRPDDAGDRYTLSVSEVARELELTPDAVRKAIHAGHLDAKQRGNAWLLNPSSVATYRERVVRRGPRAEPALTARIGNEPGSSFRLKAPKFVETARVDKRVIDGYVPHFERVAIAFSGKESNRMFVLEPSDEENEYTIGRFFVRGRFAIVEKINHPERASQAFRAFKPS